jgi:hypothetical protein
MNKEETLSEPMYGPDGKVDELAMALRRRIFWSTYSIDKYVRNQGFSCLSRDSNTAFTDFLDSLALAQIDRKH